MNSVAFHSTIYPSDCPALDALDCCSVRCLNLCYTKLFYLDSIYEKQMLSKCFRTVVVFCAVDLNVCFKAISLIAFESWHFYSRSFNA